MLFHSFRIPDKREAASLLLTRLTLNKVGEVLKKADLFIKKIAVIYELHADLKNSQPKCRSQRAITRFYKLLHDIL